MKTTKLFFSLLAIAVSLVFVQCTSAEDPIIEPPVDPGVGESSDVLLVKKFTTAPIFDGDVDAIWATARPLVSSASVPYAGNRLITLNTINSGPYTNLEPVDLFEPYAGESYNYTLRGGHDGTYLYLLFEYEDAADSRDRESWYFDAVASVWKQENKYANFKNDKFYEDKFGFMFPIKVNGNYPEGFAAGTCAATCHKNLTLVEPSAGQKTTRHYMKNAGELADLWHWKRNRNVLTQSVDDGFCRDAEGKDGKASANGRKGDSGVKMYDDKPIFTDAVTGKKGPKWVKKGATNYYWITLAELASGAAQTVTGVAANGVLTLSDGSTIDPNTDLAAYAQGKGNKRFPSITVNPGADDFKTDPKVRAKHTGTKWVIEIKRKLNTLDPNDALFEIGTEMPFGIAIFENAAIAHGVSNFKKMKIE